jgi:branched-chain amino acid transport system permease protein
VDYLIAALYTAVVLGSIYAVSAVGLTLIYGTMRFLNLAHGGMFVAGGYVAWLLTSKAGLPVLAGIMAAIGTGAILGLVVFRLILRPLLGSPRWDTATIFASVGLAIVLEAATLLIFGPRLRSLPPLVSGGLQLGSIVVRYNALLTGLIALVLLGATNLFLKRSRHGIALRAVSENVTAAFLMGIPARRTYASALAIGTALASGAGVLLTSFFLLRPTSGLDPMMRALLVIVFGGLGSIPGTVVAAYTVGLLEAAVAIVFGGRWRLPALFLFMIVVLLVRPHGLFGRPEEARL